MAFSCDEDESPASPDPIPSDLENASVTQLMEYLEQLRMKLIRLSDQPTNHLSSNIPVIPLNLEVPPEIRSTAIDLPGISGDISPNYAHDFVSVHNDLNDQEEEELREIAMMSLKPREVEKTPAVRSPSPMSLSSLPDEDCEIKTHDETILSEKRSSCIDDEDAEALRREALHSIFKKASSVSANASSTQVSSGNVIPSNIAPIIPHPADSTSASIAQINSVMLSNNSLSNSHPQNRFIIDYGSESSSDSDSDGENDEELSQKIEALSKEISFGQQTSLSPAEALKNLRKVNVNLNKLTDKERREYLVLREEIEKLDILINDDAPRLFELEGEYLKLKKSSIDMKKQHLEAKKHYLKMRKQLIQAQLHERKMREAYLAASKVVAHTVNLSKQADEVVGMREKDFTNNVKETKDCLAKCLLYGRKIEGDAYAKPLVKRPINRLIKLEKRKKKLEYRQLTLLQLIAKRNEEEAEAKRKNEERRKAEERIRKNQEDLSGLISDFTRDDLSKSILLISHMREICNTNNYYPDMMETFLGRDSHRNHHPRTGQEASVSRVDCLRPLDLSLSSGIPQSKPISTSQGRQSDSPLLSLSSFRLNKYFEAISGDSATSDVYCNRIEASKVLCWRELATGNCETQDCSMQHEKSYILSELDKLVDIISFDPSIANVTPQELAGKPGSKEHNSVHRKMVNFATRFRHKQPDEPFESIAGQLIKLVRDRIKDKNILEVERVKTTCPQSQATPIFKGKQIAISKKKKIPFRNSGVNSNKINNINRKKFANRKKVKGK